MIHLERAHREWYHDPCTPVKISHIRRVAGELNYIGFGSCTPACHAASEILSRLAQLTVSDVVFARKTHPSLQSLDTTIHYRRPTTFTTYLTYSDSSAGKSAYGQTGYLTGIFCQSTNYYCPSVVWLQTILNIFLAHVCGNISCGLLSRPCSPYQRPSTPASSIMATSPSLSSYLLLRPVWYGYFT